jgi:hypothetical protein
MSARNDALPWHRHRWPWLLMAGPATVLVAGAITTWIAFRSADGLVAEDYYKRGLAINKVLKREEAARALGVSATAVLQGHELLVRLKGSETRYLFVHLAHGTRAGFDQRLRLERAPDGAYRARLEELPAGRWQAAIEDPAGTWRIVRELR